MERVKSSSDASMKGFRSQGFKPRLSWGGVFPLFVSVSVLRLLEGCK